MKNAGRADADVDVLVVGGGIAGLAAAFELRARGVSFLVLDRGARAGGVILTERRDGFTIDAGPDALLTQKPEAIALCRELGLADRLVPTQPPRLAYIQRGGRLHPLPAGSVLGFPTRFGPFIRTRLFSLAGKLRMAREPFVAAGRDADESIGSFIGRRFGAEAVDYLAEPLLAGIHAGDVDRLSMPALFPRFVEAERRHGSLLKAFRRQARVAVRVGAEPDSPFRSLPGGIGELVDALIAALPGGSIRLHTHASRVDRDVDGLTIDTSKGAFHGRAVIFCAPAYATGQLLRPLDADLGSLCEEIPYASAATVAFGFARDAVAHSLAGSGFVVPRVERTGILAASWLSSKWPGRAPAGHVLLRTFVGGARDPRALEHTDDQLVALSIAALTPLLGIRGAPLFTRVYRFERANAQHEVGHLARMEKIERALAKQPGVFVTGSGFRGLGVPDCVADARATAKAAAEWLAKNPTTEGTELTRRSR